MAAIRRRVLGVESQPVASTRSRSPRSRSAREQRLDLPLVVLGADEPQARAGDGVRDRRGTPRRPPRPRAGGRSSPPPGPRPARGAGEGARQREADDRDVVRAVGVALDERAARLVGVDEHAPRGRHDLRDHRARGLDRLLERQPVDGPDARARLARAEHAAHLESDVETPERDLVQERVAAEVAQRLPRADVERAVAEAVAAAGAGATVSSSPIGWVAKPARERDGAAPSRPSAYASHGAALGHRARAAARCRWRSRSAPGAAA